MAARVKARGSSAGYGAALARVHDDGFGDFARDSAPGLLALLRGSGPERGLVVDLGCGSGIWAAELLAAGYDVLGIDRSAAMLRLARERAPGATFRRGSFVDARLPDCVAVTALGEVVNYLFDPRSGPGALRRLLRRAHRALEPGGLVVLDFARPGRGRATAGGGRLFEGAGWTMFVETEEDGRARILERRITTFTREGALWRRSFERHRLRLYGTGELLREARAAGFRARSLRGYGDRAFPPGYGALVARKP